MISCFGVARVRAPPHIHLFPCEEREQSVSKTILIGTRGSQLATTQSGMMRDQLSEHWGDAIDVRLEIISTKGDVNQQSLSQIGGQGVFTREIERALLDGRVQLAVHTATRQRCSQRKFFPSAPAA